MSSGATVIATEHGQHQPLPRQPLERLFDFRSAPGDAPTRTTTSAARRISSATVCCHWSCATYRLSAEFGRRFVRARPMAISGAQARQDLRVIRSSGRRPTQAHRSAFIPEPPEPERQAIIAERAVMTQHRRTWTRQPIDSLR